METNNEVNHLRQSLSIYDEKLKPIIKEKGKLYATKFLFDLKLGYSLRELKDYIDYFSAIVLSFEMQERDIKVNEYDKLKEEKEYAEAEGKRLSEVATHWKKECDKLKEDKEKLVEALKNLCKVAERETANLIAWDGAISLDASIDRARKAIKQAESK